MDKKQQWADEVLNSLEGIKRAIPKDDLLGEIITRIPNKKESEIIPLKHIRWIAVAASVVIMVNVYALRLQKNSSNNTEENLETQISLLTDYTF